MKVKTYLTMCVLCLLSVSPARAFDLSGGGPTEMDRAIYGTVLSDLIVGDKMRVPSIFTCLNNGVFMISGAAFQVDQSEYQSEFIAEIIAGGEVAITISTAHMKKPSRQDAFLYLYPCQDSSNAQFYPVKSVNGFETLDAYLKSDFFTKLPKP